ncbi:hypothetical protein BU26DRAFT_430724 [Trematosphaeria pertusa]|uniref:Zn(2)-C6 fungal-type domain-containing protein n=1 Tax=Trematosphaeria pertusa TaxID=390896 RepID=A0A6A6I743_9PLEO|nr:uncharacterized protein BU26DRAFT_430724 [Trematosphaeria pertusa]KAF2246374.1 hypothetical protein BU26DRAFT_430724 [Trematosphaeria pertusa]
MPPGRTRHSNPQGRQKSCSECAKAKRRCDLQQPNCLRCTRQKLRCTYPPPPQASVPAMADSEADTPVANAPVGNVDVAMPFDVDVSDIPSALDAGLDFDFSAALNSFGTLAGMLRNDGMALSRPNSVTAKEFPTNILAPLSASRVEYSIEQLKLMPRMMVEENATHWSHPRLYEDYMPRPLQVDVYAACALYIARNDTNATFVARHIIDRAQNLIAQPCQTAPIEMLARAHALLLYNTMLVCSDDLRYYHAENLSPYLEAVGADLHELLIHETEQIGTLPLYPSNAARDAWTSFIFRESCRRTLLAVFQTVAIFNLIRGRFTTCRHEIAAGNRLTVSTELWAAMSPLEFAIAWNEKKHYLVKGLDFGEVLQQANADDVDAFARMVMVGLMGIDDMRGWLLTRGGKL